MALMRKICRRSLFGLVGLEMLVLDRFGEKILGGSQGHSLLGGREWGKLWKVKQYMKVLLCYY